MSVPYEIVLIGQIANGLAQCVKEPLPDSFFAFTAWWRKTAKILQGEAFNRVLEWSKKYSPQDAKKLDEKKLNFLKQVCLIDSRHKDDDDPFRALSSEESGLEGLYQKEIQRPQIDDLYESLRAAKQDILDVETTLRNVEQKNREDSADEKTLETKQEIEPAKWRKAWTCIKKIPNWIYFLAALLTCIYILWWLWTKIFSGPK